MNRKLFELQEVDNQILSLKRERSKLDDGTHARGERDTLQLAFDEERTRLSTLTSERNDKELQLKSAEEKIARQQSRLMNATSSHEVTALQRDIKALTAQRGDFDEALLNLMDVIEGSTRKVADLEHELGASNKVVTEVEANFARDTSRLEKHLEDMRRQREIIASQLDAASLGKYNEYAKRGGGVAVAHPDKGNCSACGMALTPFNLREAKSQQWPTCESCGRLLFIE